MNKFLFFLANAHSLLVPRLLIPVLLLAIVAACQTINEQGDSSHKQRLAMVSNFDSSYTVAASKNTVTWKPDASFVRGSERIKPDTYKPVIEFAIEKALKIKGYKFGNNFKESDLLVSYAAGLEMQLSDEEIIQRFGMMPGLQGSASKQDNYQKGTIIVDIYDRNTNKSVWRGVVQGYTDLGLSRADRSKRMENIMQQLLAEFPAIL